MNCVHGVRLDKDCIFCINGTEPKVELNSEELAKAIVKMPIPATDDRSIEDWAVNLANDISKGKD